MSNINFFCKLTIVIPQLPWLFSMTTAVLLSIELVDSVISDYVNLFNITMCAFASKCFSIELVTCTDGW